jgi:predicted nucleotidyltransferase component of viral defense system
LKDKIRNASNDLDLPFNEIWQRIILERFLVRLSKSNESQHFILKGGSLLARYIDIGRETKDLDFLLTKVQSEKTKIAKSIEAIIGTTTEDGFSFNLISVEDLTHTHMKYPGFSVHLTCLFGNMKGQLDLDIGTGDTVNPVQRKLDLIAASGKPVFESSVSLLVYPAETIFAEKLHTALVRGSANSRMKDYHDMFSLISSKGTLDKKILKNARC